MIIFEIINSRRKNRKIQSTLFGVHWNINHRMRIKNEISKYGFEISLLIKIWLAKIAMFIQSFHMHLQQP